MDITRLRAHKATKLLFPPINRLLITSTAQDNIHSNRNNQPGKQQQQHQKPQLTKPIPKSKPLPGKEQWIDKEKVGIGERNNLAKWASWSRSRDDVDLNLFRRYSATCFRTCK